VIPIAMRNLNFELRTSRVGITTVQKDAKAKRATGVAYTNVLTGEEFEQPAQIVILSPTPLNIRATSCCSPASASPTIRRRRRAWSEELLLPDGRERDALLRGAALQSVHECGRLEDHHRDDFNTNWSFDRSKHGYIAAS
jgi:gluconate 2-dehydrogenase alpha chain